MSRYAPKISVNDFKSMLVDYAKKKFDKDETDIEELDDGDVDSIIEMGIMSIQFSKVHEDIQKIKFDYENVRVEKYLELSNGVPIAFISSGGDWECPLLFALYFDGSTFRGYVPTEGNVFNRTLKQAYGNATDDEDEADALKYFGDKNYHVLCPDFDKAIVDIESRIKVRP